jgi:16S rRNA (guanine966-N2)-methyltransferase
MRIIAGAFKGRRLNAPEGDAIRPTSDRMREAVFNLLMHGKFGGEHIINRRVADLCCGTGALGLEALSRGASECMFVDADKTSLALAKANALHCNAVASSQFVLSDATRLPAARQPVALVLMDAPYADAITARAYQSLRAGHWFEPDALFVVEQPKTAEIPALPDTTLLDTRPYGKAQLLIYKIA